MGKAYELKIGEVVVLCSDAQAAAELIREYNEGRRTRSRRPQDQETDARKVLLEGPYRTAINTLVAHHPDGIFADQFLAKSGFEDNPKGFGGFMTGLRKQLNLAGLPSGAILRERRKDGTDWKNHFRLDDKAAETLRRWIET